MRTPNLDRLAAEQGDAQAQNNLGALYATGQGVEKDFAEAVKWYPKAAEQDNPQGLANLASMYGEGRGVPEDAKAAFVLCAKAAKLGFAVAQNNLGLMFANGEGVPTDYVEAWSEGWMWLDGGGFQVHKGESNEKLTG